MFDNIYYFAYGSNMNRERMYQRTGIVHHEETATLKGFDLVFNCGHAFISYANIIKADKESFVEGVLYKVQDRHIYQLDFHENWPRNYEKFYFQHADKLCFGYWSVNPDFKSKALPDLEYLNICLVGAREHGLDYTYQKLTDYYIQNKKRYESRDFHNLKESRVF